MDEDERGDDAALEHTKQSRRDRLKGALSRTKSKFKKHHDRDEEADHVLSDDVNDFLAAGRRTSSNWNSGGDSLSHTAAPGSSSSAATVDQQSSRPSTSDSVAIPKYSPRRIPVPRLDVSNSSRWPGAQPLVLPDGPSNSNLLGPEYQARSHSVSSFSKRKGRGRGLSVSFIDEPPVVIGEGGDDAPTPPVEISKARLRARSVSPMPSRSQAQSSTPEHAAPSNSPFRPRPSAGHHDPPDVLRPRALQRVQTGPFPFQSPSSSTALDREFERTLQLGSGTNSPASAGGSPHSPEIIAPKPVRPVQPPPAIMETKEPRIVKKELPNTDLRRQYSEGDALRMHLDRGTPESMNGSSPGQPLRRNTDHPKQEPPNYL